MVFDVFGCFFLIEEDRTGRSLEFSNDLTKFIILKSGQILLICNISIANCKELHCISISRDQFDQSFN